MGRPVRSSRGEAGRSSKLRRLCLKLRINPQTGQGIGWPGGGYEFKAVLQLLSSILGVFQGSFFFGENATWRSRFALHPSGSRFRQPAGVPGEGVGEELSATQGLTALPEPAAFFRRNPWRAGFRAVT